MLVTMKLEKVDLAHVDLLDAHIYPIITHHENLGSHVQIGKVVAIADTLPPVC